MIRLLALAYSSSEINPFRWIQPRTASFFANSKSFVILLHLPFKVSLYHLLSYPLRGFSSDWLFVIGPTLASIRIRCCQRSGWPLAYWRFPCRCLWATPARVPFPPLTEVSFPAPLTLRQVSSQGLLASDTAHSVFKVHYHFPKVLIEHLFVVCYTYFVAACSAFQLRLATFYELSLARLEGKHHWRRLDRKLTNIFWNVFLRNWKKTEIPNCTDTDWSWLFETQTYFCQRDWRVIRKQKENLSATPDDTHSFLCVPWWWADRLWTDCGR